MRTSERPCWMRFRNLRALDEREAARRRAASRTTKADLEAMRRALDRARREEEAAADGARAARSAAGPRRREASFEPRFEESGSL